MGQGLQVWDENGVNLVDTDYRMTQIIGSVYTPDLLAGNAYLNGSIHVPEFATLSGTPFVHHISYSYIFYIRYPHPESDLYQPQYPKQVRIEGNYVRWVYETRVFPPGTMVEGLPYYNQQDYAALIIWGVY